MDEREFKGVWIPASIWLSEDLDTVEKVIYAEIDSLDNEKKGGCFASNEYFEKFCNVSERKVTQSIAHLKDLGLIEQTSFNGRTRVLRLAKNARQGRKKCEAESQNLRPSYYNNINSNLNKENIKDNIDERETNSKKGKLSFVAPTREEVIAYAKTRNREDLADHFYDYYTAQNWVDGNGKAVKSWKGKFITWEIKNDKKVNYSQNTTQPKKAKFNFTQREETPTHLAMVNALDDVEF